MELDSVILDYFKYSLIKRPVDFVSNINLSDRLILSEVGLPNGVLDFSFTGNLYMKSHNELIIGKTLDNEDISLRLDSEIITKGEDSFLAQSLSNFVRQLYAYDHLWKVLIKNEVYGKYREDKNHKKYAKELESQLLQIDSNLLQKDKVYFWGSLIEDIDFGIVG
jgi:hypothetical protein